MSSTNDAVAAEPPQGEVEVYGVTLMRYLCMMGITLVFYDYLLTLDDEVRLMWPGTLYWPKVLFYINRYASIFGMIFFNYQIMNFRPPLSLRFCQIYVWVTVVIYVGRFLAATALLCLRVIALYHGVRWMKWLVWIGFVLCYGVRVGLNVSGSYFVAESIIYSSQRDMCLTFGMRAMTELIYGIMGLVPTMAFEILLLALTIVRVIKNVKSLGPHSGPPLMQVVMREQILWFFAVVMARMSIMISWITFPPVLMTVAVNAEWGLESALISRFSLNLRSAYNHGQSTVGSRSVPSTLSPIRTHPFWTRKIPVTTGFSDGLEAETGVYGRFPDRNEGDLSEEATVDLELAIVSQTQQGGDGHDMKPIADLTPPENKLAL